MLKQMIFALTCAATLASQAVASDKSKKPKNDPDKQICRTVGETGSRLGGKRECHTQAEWDQIRVDNGDALRRATTPN